MNILITGAGGFIGRELVNVLKKTNHHLFLCVKKETKKYVSKNVKIIFEGDLLSTNLYQLTKKIDIIIHCAGLAHNLSNKDHTSYLESNTTLTYNLATAGKKNNIKKFIFLSTAGIHADNPARGKKITEHLHISTKTPYTKSKLQAENLLLNTFKNSNIDLFNLRPPAVYGRGVKGNLKILNTFIKNKLPLPLGSFNNKRSYISIENLIDSIATCIDFKGVICDSFLISDDIDLSTEELIKLLARKQKSKVSVFKFPIKIIYFIFKIFKKIDKFERLNNSFELDTTKFKKRFNWSPKN